MMRDRVPIAYQTPIRARPNDQEPVGRHLDDFDRHHIPPSTRVPLPPYGLVNGSSVACPRPSPRISEVKDDRHRRRRIAG